MNKDYDLVICGGGVIGLSIALQAACNGWTVLVLEASQLGRGSSWAGAGILPAGATFPALDPLEQLRSMSHRLHAEWAQWLQEMTGIDTEYRRCGGLYIATSPAERATLAANRLWWNEHGIDSEAWTRSTVFAKLPGLQPLMDRYPKSEFWYVAEDCRVRNPRHLAALIAACRMRGVEFWEHSPVSGFASKCGQIVAAHVSRKNPDGSEGHSDVTGARFCIAGGAWSVRILESMGIPTGILPVRGQMVLYRFPEALFSMVLNEGHRYLVPRDDGHVLVGSCEEEVGFDATTTPEMIAELRLWAEGIWPELERVPVVGQWAGLRPGSFDTFPYLGALPDLKNAYIACGHFRHGLHWSTATAVLMTQLMSGKPTDIDLEPFRLQRGHAIGRSSTRI